MVHDNIAVVERIYITSRARSMVDLDSMRDGVIHAFSNDQGTV